MIERISSLENSFSFISFTTGLMALVSAIISFAVIKYGINIPKKQESRLQEDFFWKFSLA